jgi:hypothetical protein
MRGDERAGDAKYAAGNEDMGRSQEKKLWI